MQTFNQIAGWDGELFDRTAWTGGDTPSREWLNSWNGRSLTDFFYFEQIKDCGGLNNLHNWLFGDQTIQEKLSLFKNRAEFDAWATWRAKYPTCK